MLVGVAGDTHGNLELLYELLQRLESALSVTAALVVQVGDLGVWPDPRAIDGPTLRHGGAGDFHRWLATGREAPRPTVFVAGNHEDFGYLLDHAGGEVLPGLRFLPWGEVVTFEAGGQELRIGGIGGCFSPIDYWREMPREPKNRLRRKARGARTPARAVPPPGLEQRLRILAPTQRSHFLRVEEDALIRAGGDLDLMLLHDCPTPTLSGVRGDGSVGHSWTCPAHSLGEVVATVRPRLCLHGHFHAWHPREHEGVPVVSLQKVTDRPYGYGCVGLLDVPAEGSIRVLALWDGTGVVEPEIEFRQVERDLVVEERFGEIASELVAWRERVLGGGVLDRRLRRRVHGMLEEVPELRRVARAGLRGREPVAVLERLVGDGVGEGRVRELVSVLPEIRRG